MTVEVYSGKSAKKVLEEMVTIIATINNIHIYDSWKKKKKIMKFDN